MKLRSALGHALFLQRITPFAALESSMAPRRITGLQRSIYSLYKRSLQMVQSKPVVRQKTLHRFLDRSRFANHLSSTQDTRKDWYLFVSHQFRHPTLGGSLRKKDVGAIEYYIRRGEKMLDSYKSPAVTKVSPPATEAWPLGWVAKGGKTGKGNAREV